MKLAEALILQADCQKRMVQLQQRLIRRVQEGEQPPENPNELVTELEAVSAELADLIKRINKTNSQTAFKRGLCLMSWLSKISCGSSAALTTA